MNLLLFIGIPIGYQNSRPMTHSFFFSRFASISLVFLTYCVCPHPAWAKLTLAAPFQDGAVLQRDKPVPIFGTSNPEEAITVTFADQKVTAKADASGKWVATLAPLSASAEPTEMTIAAGSESLVLQDILVGEVWICSGQSNMAFKVRDVVDAAAEMASADFPQIRQLLIAPKVADEPQTMAQAKWTPASPSTVGNFSAVAYFFAREIHKALGVPVGLVNASLGGTGVEAWMRAEALAADPNFPEVKKRWDEAVTSFPDRLKEFDIRRAQWAEAKKETEKQGGKFTRIPPRRPLGPGDKNQPSGLFNGMISPLIPYAVRGIIWYQGEHNALRHSEYASLFRGLIEQWRSDLGQGDIPFYFVQLPNFDHKIDESKTAWAFMRDAQTKALSLPETGMAIAIDIGDPSDIHPKNKQDVGKRLGILALAKVYNKGGLSSGPLFDKSHIEGDAIRVTFREAEGLEIRGTPESVFQIAAADGVFRPATARVEGETVIVSSSAVSNPEIVRYAWMNNPPVVLFNRLGLPAAPFQTKDLPPPQLNLESGEGD